MRISLLLDLAAETFPDRLAIDGDGGRLTLAELRSHARALAKSIGERQVDKVGYLGRNAPTLPVAMFGAAIAGLSFTPLNYRLPDEDLRRLAARLAPALIIADADMAPRLAGIDGVEVITRSTVDANTPAPDDWEPPVDGDDVAVLLFTSGTSGEPKAALLKHENLTSYVLQTVEFAGSAEDEAALVSVPPYHIAAISALLTGIYGGRRIVQLEAFEPTEWIGAAARHAVSHAMLVPTMLGRLLDAIEEVGAAPPALRAIAYGGGRMPLPVIRRALAMLPSVAFTNAYGLTETSSTISLLGPEDHELARSGDAAAERRLASVGKPLPGVIVAVHGNDGRVCDAGEPGEIMVRGDQVSGRYSGRIASNPDGWFATNDRGWFDADGYLYVDGRLDDVIVRGGENISPGEIEEVIRAHPAITDVAVVGAPDEQWGEKIVAFLVTNAGRTATATEIADWVRSRLRSTRTPALFHFRESLPYNETGKLLRRVLRDEIANRT